jgi:hypothetical protein
MALEIRRAGRTDRRDADTDLGDGRTTLLRLAVLKDLTW